MENTKDRSGSNTEDKTLDSLDEASRKGIDLELDHSLTVDSGDLSIPVKNRSLSSQRDCSEKEAANDKNRVDPREGKGAQGRPGIASTNIDFQGLKILPSSFLHRELTLNEEEKEEEPDIIGIIGFSVSCLGLLLIGLLLLIDSPYFLIVVPPVLIAGFILSLFGDSWFGTLGWIISGVPLTLLLSYGLSLLVLFYLLS